MSRKPKEIPRNYLKSVRDLYENYPYPPRDPEDERKRLHSCYHEFLELINFYCFKGKNTFSKSFRALSAGGGTGDQTIFLAEQLRDNPDAEVVHVDISNSSIVIAKRRAEVRGLTNITWHHTSIFDLPSLDLGKFNYITCYGVLHHLEDPPKGLKILRSMLKDDGGMLLMVYGKYGRTGLEQLQELMRLISMDGDDIQAKIENAKTTLVSLPETNWFKRGERLFSDHKFDTGICDMILHPNDRSYTVAELYALAEGCDLNIIELLELGRVKYKVDSYIKDAKLLGRLGKYSKRQQQAIAELISGALIVHHCYLSKSKEDTIAKVDDLDNVPFFFVTAPPNAASFLSDYITNNQGKLITLTANLGVDIAFYPSRHLHLIFKFLDGTRSLREIFKEVRKYLGLTESRLKDEELLGEFEPIYELFSDIDYILLRHKSVGKFRTSRLQWRRDWGLYDVSCQE